MQHILVHIELDMGLGPIGAWGYSNGNLVHFYPDSLDTAISARAREAMAIRDLDMAVPDWFRFLATSHPNALDDFQTLEDHHQTSLPVILNDFRRHWYAIQQP